MLKVGRKIETIPEHLKMQVTPDTILAATTWVHRGELANGLAEIHLMPPDYRGMQRYQLIWVERDDRIAEFRRRLGPAVEYAGTMQFQIPALWEHSVAELLDIAEELRGGESRAQQIAAEIAAESEDTGGVITEFQNRQEQNREVWHNRSKFGPLVKVERANRGA